MKNRKIINHGAVQVVSILAAFAFAQPVMAECVQSDPPADTILAIDANNGCVDIQGQEGCTIKGGVGTCTYTDLDGNFFKINSSLNSDGSLSWALDQSSTITGIDTAVIGGGSGGKNNCGYIHNFDVASGSGGDCKTVDSSGNCTGFQNITSLDICTDGQDDIAPPPPVVAEKLTFCSAPGDTNDIGELDDTGIRCPVYTLLDPPPPDSGLVVGDQKPVVVCNLEKDKKDWGTTDGSDVCCQCGIAEADQTACVVTEDSSECTQSMTVNPTQSVELIFFKDDEDPCTWIKTSRGWKQWCY